jgi:hypothetical protein
MLGWTGPALTPDRRRLSEPSGLTALGSHGARSPGQMPPAAPSPPTATRQWTPQATPRTLHRWRPRRRAGRNEPRYHRAGPGRPRAVPVRDAADDRGPDGLRGQRAEAAARPLDLHPIAWRLCGHPRHRPRAVLERGDGCHHRFRQRGPAYAAPGARRDLRHQRRHHDDGLARQPRRVRLQDRDVRAAHPHGRSGVAPGRLRPALPGARRGAGGVRPVLPRARDPQGRVRRHGRSLRRRRRERRRRGELAGLRAGGLHRDRAHAVLERSDRHHPHGGRGRRGQPRSSGCRGDWREPRHHLNGRGRRAQGHACSEAPCARAHRVQRRYRPGGARAAAGHAGRGGPTRRLAGRRGKPGGDPRAVPYGVQRPRRVADAAARGPARVAARADVPQRRGGPRAAAASRRHAGRNAGARGRGPAGRARAAARHRDRDRGRRAVGLGAGPAAAVGRGPRPLRGHRRLRELGARREHAGGRGRRAGGRAERRALPAGGRHAGTGRGCAASPRHLARRCGDARDDRPIRVGRGAGCMACGRGSDRAGQRCPAQRGDRAAAALVPRDQGGASGRGRRWPAVRR